MNAPLASVPTGNQERRSATLVLPAILWLTAFFVVPVGLLLVQNMIINPGAAARTAAAYVTDPFYRGVLLNSVRLAGVTALGTLIVAYPAAYFLSRVGPVTQKVLMLATFLPITLGAVIKTFGWTILLRGNGPLNMLLLKLGVIDAPLRMLFTETGLHVGMINVFLPFMIIPLYTVFRGMDPNLYNAALCLGARPVTAFVKVIVPLSLPGIRAGVTVVFALEIGTYVTPNLLIGDRFPTLPSTIARGYLYLHNETIAGVASIVLMLITIPVLLIASERGARR